MLNRTTFYDKIKRALFNGALSDLQLQTTDAILDECGDMDVRQVAYVFATAYWECHNPRHPELRMTPMKEFGGERYLRSKPYYPYFGRGLSQLTWLANYKRESIRTGIDLVNNPDAILSLPLAANSHVYCMAHGLYTGRKLSDYINAQGCNFLSARKIINGMDRAAEVAGFAREFLRAMV